MKARRFGNDSQTRRRNRALKRLLSGSLAVTASGLLTLATPAVADDVIPLPVATDPAAASATETSPATTFDFNDGEQGWTPRSGTGNEPTLTWVNPEAGSGFLAVTERDDQRDGAMYPVAGVFVPGQKYTFTADARFLAEGRGGQLWLTAQTGESDFQILAVFNVGTDWTAVTGEFTMPEYKDGYKPSIALETPFQGENETGDTTPFALDNVAFANAIETSDPVVASDTSGELSEVRGDAKGLASDDETEGIVVVFQPEHIDDSGKFVEEEDQVFVVSDEDGWIEVSEEVLEVAEIGDTVKVEFDAQGDIANVVVVEDSTDSIGSSEPGPEQRSASRSLGARIPTALRAAYPADSTHDIDVIVMTPPGQGISATQSNDGRNLVTQVQNYWHAQSLYYSTSNSSSYKLSFNTVETPILAPGEYPYPDCKVTDATAVFKKVIETATNEKDSNGKDKNRNRKLPIVWSNYLSGSNAPSKRHLVILVPKGCQLGSVMGQSSESSRHNTTSGGIVVAWFGDDANTLAHELGHNFGFVHSGYNDDAYGDTLDVMSNGGYSATGGPISCIPLLSSRQAEEAGFIPEDKILKLESTASGTYDIDALSYSGSNKKVIQYKKSGFGHTDNYHYLELRSPIGQDNMCPGMIRQNSHYGIRVLEYNKYEINSRLGDFGKWTSLGSKRSYHAGDVIRVDYANPIKVERISSDGKTAKLTINPKTFSTPTVTGEAKVGKILTANINGAPSNTSYTYQWLRGDASITNATGKTYTLVAADASKIIKVKVTAKVVGYLDADNRSSGLTIAKGDFTGGTASISGTRKVGNTLTCSLSSVFSPLPTNITYKWYRSDAATTVRKTASTYTLEGSDAGKTMNCTATAQKTGYNDKSTNKATSGTIAKGDFTGGTASISGTKKVGNTLTCSSSGFSPAPTNVTYKWYRSDAATVRKTASTYKLDGSDAGKTMYCTATAQKTGYNDKTTIKSTGATIGKDAPKTVTVSLRSKNPNKGLVGFDSVASATKNSDSKKVAPGSSFVVCPKAFSGYRISSWTISYTNSGEPPTSEWLHDWTDCIRYTLPKTITDYSIWAEFVKQ